MAPRLFFGAVSQSWVTPAQFSTKKPGKLSGWEVMYRDPVLGEVASEVPDGGMEFIGDVGDVIL